MRESLLTAKEYLPLIVAVISAILAFILGKMSEKNKKFNIMAEESIQLFLAEMYKEVIAITTISKYNVKKIKKFLIKYSSLSNNYKIYDGELFFGIFNLLNEMKLNNISNHNLQKEFEKISFRIEKLFSERTMAISKGYDWWVLKKVKIRWLSLPLNILFISKDIIEYVLIILVMLSVFCITDKYGNHGAGLTSTKFRGMIGALTMLAGMIYGTLLMIRFMVNIFIVKNEWKRKKLVKKL